MYLELQIMIDIQITKPGINDYRDLSLMVGELLVEIMEKIKSSAFNQMRKKPRKELRN